MFPAPRCIAMYQRRFSRRFGQCRLSRVPALAIAASLALGPLSSSRADDEESRGLHDYAEVFVNQYFEPEEHLLLGEEGRKKSQALAHFSLGRSLEAQGRMVEAIDAYLEVLENDPGRHFLARKTAYLLARNGSVEEALDLLERNLESNPEQPFSHIALSEFVSTYQDNEEGGRARAIQLAETAVEKFPAHPAVVEHLVRLYSIQGRRDDARELVQSTLDRPNADPEFWLRMGKLAARLWPGEQGEPSSASVVTRLHEKALDTAGEDMEVVESVADFFHATGRLDRAVEEYQRVIEAHPDRLDVREKLARVYGAREQTDMVVATLEEILEIDPDSERTHRQLAQIHIGREDYASAIPHLRKALNIADGGANEYGALARMMIQEEEHEAAVEFLAEAAHRFPEVPDFPFLSTFSLSRLERWEESIAAFEKTMEIAGDENAEMLNESFYFRFAASHERAGNLDEAEKLFRKTIEMLSRLDPESQDEDFTATVYNYLGYMWIENDLNIDEAGELIKTAAELSPESGAIADSLGWWHFKKGRHEEAKKELLRAEQLVENPDAVIYDHIARAFYQLGDSEPALEYMDKALELDPENEEYIERRKRFEAGEDPASVEKAPSPVESESSDSESSDASGGSEESDTPPGPKEESGEEKTAA